MYCLKHPKKFIGLVQLLDMILRELIFEPGHGFFGAERFVEIRCPMLDRDHSFGLEFLKGVVHLGVRDARIVAYCRC